MNRKFTIPLAMGIAVCSVAAAAYGEEKAAPAPAPVAQSAVSNQEQALTTEGSVAAMDLSSPAPSMKLASADGKMLTFVLDLKATSLWDGSQEIKGWGPTSNPLRIGQQVKVHSVWNDGRWFAKSIRISRAEKTALPAAPTKRLY